MKDRNDVNLFINSLDNQKLKKALGHFGLDPKSLPITTSTRSLHVKKLINYLESNNVDIDRNSLNSIVSSDSHNSNSRKVRNSMSSFEDVEAKPKPIRQTRMSYNPQSMNESFEMDSSRTRSPRRKTVSKEPILITDSPVKSRLNLRTSTQSPTRKPKENDYNSSDANLSSTFEKSTKEVLKTQGPTLKSSTPNSSARKQVQSSKAPVTYSQAISKLKNAKDGGFSLLKPLSSRAQNTNEAPQNTSMNLPIDRNLCYTLFLRWLRFMALLTIFCVVIAAIYYGFFDYPNLTDDSNALDVLENLN